MKITEDALLDLTTTTTDLRLLEIRTVLINSMAIMVLLVAVLMGLLLLQLVAVEIMDLRLLRFAVAAEIMVIPVVGIMDIFVAVAEIAVGDGDPMIRISNKVVIVAVDTTMTQATVMTSATFLFRHGCSLIVN